MVLFHPGIYPAMKNWCCYTHPFNIWLNALHWHYIWISYRLFNKNEGIKLYIIQRTLRAIHWNSWLNAVNSCQIGLFKKDKLLLENNKLFKYLYLKASSSGVFDLDDYIQFTLSSCTYSIDDFNLKQQFYNKNKIGMRLISKT